MDTSQKTISFCVQATKITSEILQSIMREYLSGNAEKTGKYTYGQLARKGTLESIEVTENNIKDFLKTAKKYDIDYALKKDKSTSPPTYHIFFTSSKSENFQNAFKEYAFGIEKKIKNKDVTKVVNREQIKRNAKAISDKLASKSKEKHLNKSEVAR